MVNSIYTCCIVTGDRCDSVRGGGTTEAQHVLTKLCPVRHTLDPAGGAYKYPPYSLAGFNESYF